jgi:hypothetical protein
VRAQARIRLWLWPIRSVGAPLATTPGTIFLPSRDDSGIWTTFDGATAIGPQFQTTADAPVRP